jgi:diacylglycerol kinase (ATP)
MHVVLIGNPGAGHKMGLPTNAATVQDAIAALNRAGVAPVVWLTEGPGHATELARRAVSEGAETVIAAGGDGTVREVAQVLVDSSATLGVMPLGSVMNIARTLGITRDNLLEAARVIKEGRLIQMDVGEVNKHYFLEVAGVGIDAALGPLAQQIDSGEWSSLGTMLRVVFGFRPQEIIVVIDGERETLPPALIVVIANTPYYGPLELNPEARVDDHQFDVKVFTCFSRTELLLYGLQILRGRRPYSPKVHYHRGRTIAVSSRRPLPVHADFVDPVGVTPVTFRLLPNGLRVWANPALWESPEPTSVSMAAG